MKKFTFSPKTISIFAILVIATLFVSAYMNWYSTPFQKGFAEFVGQIHPELGKNPFWIATLLVLVLVGISVYRSVFHKEAAEAPESNAQKATTQFSLEDRKKLLKTLKESYQNRLKSKLTHEWQYSNVKYQKNREKSEDAPKESLRQIPLKLIYTNKGLPENVRPFLKPVPYPEVGKTIQDEDLVTWFTFQKKKEQENVPKRVMILGNTGVGKTVKLLDWACQLIEHAKQGNASIPVVINAVSWRSKKIDGKPNTIKDWLIEVLPDTIGSKALTQKLIEEKRLFLLIDGLNEIEIKPRFSGHEKSYNKHWLEQNPDDFIQYIANIDLFINNDQTESEQKLFIEALCQWAGQDETNNRFILTGDTNDFIYLQNKLPFIQAIFELQELTPETLKVELETFRDKNEMHGVATNLLLATEKDTLLERILCNSFYLNLAFSLFSTPGAKIQKFETEAEYETYLKTLLVERKLKETQTPEQTQKWLTWLAKTLNTERKRAFQLGDLHSEMLINKYGYFLLTSFAQAFYFSYHLILLLFFVAGLTDVFKDRYTVFFQVISESFQCALLLGIIVSFFYYFRISKETTFDPLKYISRIPDKDNKDFTDYLFRKQIIDIDAKYTYKWSYGKFRKLDLEFFNKEILNFYILQTLLITLTFALWGHIKVGFFIGSTISLIVLLIQTISVLGLIEKTTKITKTPYYTLLYNSIISISYSERTIFIIVLILIFAWFSFNLHFIWLSLVVGGTIHFFQSALFRHLVLRLCLWLEGALPLRLVRFLRAMEQTGIIERDGGTWRFRHQLLQDWFAAKD